MSGEKLEKGIADFSKEEYDNYQEYLSSRKEWPGVNVRAGKSIIYLARRFQIHGCDNMSILISDSRVTLNIPMLIMELYRLVPYKEGRYVHFHPFNMPYIKVRKIELVGTVTNVKRNANNLLLTSKTRDKVQETSLIICKILNLSLLAVEDGTGVVQVNFKLEQYMFLLKQRQEIDEKYRNQAGNLRKSEAKMNKSYPKKFPETRPGFSYPHDVPLQDVAVRVQEHTYI